jgi:hypothetical protein
MRMRMGGLRRRRGVPLYRRVGMNLDECRLR